MWKHTQSLCWKPSLPCDLWAFFTSPRNGTVPLFWSISFILKVSSSDSAPSDFRFWYRLWKQSNFSSCLTCSCSVKSSQNKHYWDWRSLVTEELKFLKLSFGSGVVRLFETEDRKSERTSHVRLLEAVSLIDDSWFVSLQLLNVYHGEFVLSKEKYICRRVCNGTAVRSEWRFPDWSGSA